MKKVAFLCMALMLLSFAAVAQETGEPEKATNITATSSEGLTIFESGKFKLEIDGRLQLGGATYMGSDNPMGSGTEVRRARFALKPTWGNWNAQFDLDFSGNEVQIKDMWVAYTGFDHFIIKAGNQKTQFSMEEVTSSRYITFLERASLNAFTPDRRMGLSVVNWHKQWRIFAGLFGQGAEDVDESDEPERGGYNFRLTAAPLMKGSTYIHVGGSYSHMSPSAGSGDKVKFSYRPESHITQIKFVNTGKISDVDNWDVYGTEFAAASGPVLLQAEYAWTRVNRLELNPTAKFDGYYGFISWFVTGEKRPYSSEEGEAAGRTIPKNKKLGTIELAARYSCLDLNDAASSGIMGGKMRNITFGANWYPYANLKFTLNYILVNNDQYATGDGDYLGNDDFSVLAAGIQFLF